MLGNKYFYQWINDGTHPGISLMWWWKDFGMNWDSENAKEFCSDYIENAEYNTYYRTKTGHEHYHLGLVFIGDPALVT